MAIINQVIEKNYAIYNADCIEVMKDISDESIHLSVYSPPFCSLYQYSSSELDLSNCDSYEDFFNHYEYVVKELCRITKKGRISAVHCIELPSGNCGKDSLTDFPGDIIRLHNKVGFEYIGRHCVWKEPLKVRNRTMAKNLTHATVVKDSIYCGVASADFILLFRKKGENDTPVKHENGFKHYAGEREMPVELLKYKDYDGNQIENRYSHWIWQQYASSFWDDIRIDNILSFKDARDPEDEKHATPTQLDVFDRIVDMRTNENEIVFSPFMGVASEIFSAVSNGRRGIGVELKESYFRQAVENMKLAEKRFVTENEVSIFGDDKPE